MPPKRGEIYWVNWSRSRGSEQAGRRPAVVISGDSFNQMFPVVTVVAMTPNLRPSRISVPVPQGVCPQESRILPWQVMTAAQERLLGEPIGVLPASIQSQLDERLRLVWGL